MSIIFHNPVTNENFEYEIYSLQDDGNDVLLSFLYDHDDEKKMLYFIFTKSDFVTFKKIWINLQNRVILKNQLDLIRVVIYDIRNDKTIDYQLIEFLSLEKQENNYILSFRYLGQFIENEIVSQIISQYKDRNDIKEILSFLEKTERKEFEICIKNGLEFKSDLFRLNKITGMYEFDSEKAVYKILGFEKNDYTSDEFYFRRYPKYVTNTMLQIQFNHDAVTKLMVQMKSFLDIHP